MPRLGLDVGDVLSVRSDAKFDGQNIYKAAMTGAYAFCVCFILKYGAENPYVISRTNEGTCGRLTEASQPRRGSCVS